MSLPKLSSREAEATIQKAIQYFDSGVEPSIRKASNVLFYKSDPRGEIAPRRGAKDLVPRLWTPAKS